MHSILSLSEGQYHSPSGEQNFFIARPPVWREVCRRRRRAGSVCPAHRDHRRAASFRSDRRDRPPLQPHPFPVSDALAETAESFRDFATERGHDLLCRITPELTFCGDEYAVRQLASILPDNAARYASDGILRITAVLP